MIRPDRSAPSCDSPPRPEREGRLTGSGAATRRFEWLSSSHGDPGVLADLDSRLAVYYGARSADDRSAYQAMLDSQGEEPAEAGPVLAGLLRYLDRLSPRSILEVGCGNGRLFRQLRRRGFQGRYSGVELSVQLTEWNRQRSPDATWFAAGAYALPFEAEAFDCCVAYYVLEHLVYPEKGLLEMLRVLAPGGRLVLVFPDFACFGILPSQVLGLAPGGTARERFRAGRVLDAFVSLYDSRIRLPRMLKRATRRFGPFPVNTRPLCLSYANRVSPDVDAVYIATKEELHAWSLARGLRVEYPEGTAGSFSDNAFMVLHREPDGGGISALAPGGVPAGADA